MKRPLRTLLFSTLYPSVERPLHGIFVETRLRELLSSGEVETRVVAPVPWFPSGSSRWGEYGRMARTPRREVWHGVEVLHPRYLLLPRVGMTLAPFTLAVGSLPALQSIQASGFDFDVIDAHYYYPDGVAAALLARWLGKPLTITARGTDLNLIPKHRVPGMLIDWAASRADASIGVCRALMDVLRERGVPARKLHVMRNGVDLERFSPRKQIEAQRRLGLRGSPMLLSVGHLIERKGHHLVVDSVKLLRDRWPSVHLYIIGDGELRGSLGEQIQSAGLSDYVTLVGSVANERLADWFSAADALVLASSREGWANVLLESMACGCPVVATRLWGTPEVVTDPRVGVLVDVRSAEAIASGIDELLRYQIDRDFVRSYAEGFSWAATTHAQIALFDHLLEGSP